MNLSLTKHVKDYLHEMETLLELFDSTKAVKVGDVYTKFDVPMGGNKSAGYTVYIGNDPPVPKVYDVIHKFIKKHGIDEIKDMSKKDLGPYVADLGFALDEVTGFSPADIGKGGVKIGKDKWKLSDVNDIVGFNDTKHTLKVFANVYKIVQTWVKKFRMEFIGMAYYSDSNLPSRVKLYRRMARTMAPKLGMTLISDIPVSDAQGKYQAFIFINNDAIKK